MCQNFYVIGLRPPQWNFIFNKDERNNKYIDTIRGIGIKNNVQFNTHTYTAEIGS